MVCRSSSFLWAGKVWLPLQGRDGKRRTLARAHPAGRGQLEWTVKLIRLAAVSNDQRHVLIDRSGVNRLPAKCFREHTHSLTRIRRDRERRPVIVETGARPAVLRGCCDEKENDDDRQQTKANEAIFTCGQIAFSHVHPPPRQWYHQGAWQKSHSTQKTQACPQD
jgi:hypothetical protein